ncbi:MAG: HAMP domain-containing protein, partial [Proteobacteria bacterium]|nr:HAMP domain-containing protein [Pseudomonadota bacterium]
MRSLFLRIFLGFWLAAVLLGASLVVLALTTDPHRAVFERHEERLWRAGQQMLATYRTGASPPPDSSWSPTEPGAPPMFLFRGAEGPLFGPPAPRMARRLAAQAFATGERQLHWGPRGLWLAFPLADDYIVVAEEPPLSRLERLLDPWGLSLRLGLAFVIIGVVSWFLARSFSAPIQRLQLATRRLAGGDLGARVGPSL